MNDAPAWLVALSWAFFLSPTFFVFAMDSRNKCVRGTAGRYWWGTAVKVFLAGSVGSIPLMCFRAVYQPDPGWWGAAAIFAAIVAAEFYVYLRDPNDDDDWFTRTGKRLRKGLRRGADRLRQAAAGLGPRPAPSSG